MYKNVDDKAKSIRKDVNSDIVKLNSHIKDVNKVMDKINETVIPTVKEKLGLEIYIIT